MLPFIRVAVAIATGIAGFLTVRKLASGDKTFSPFDTIPLDAYADRDPTLAGQCDATPKPGVLLFRAWIIALYGEHPGPNGKPQYQNILRDCKIGSPTEHWQGRAWDWMIPSPAAAKAMVDMLLDSDAQGRPHALARRAGIMYLIYNRRMWRSYPWQDQPAGSWHPYGGESPHTDHVHLSFGWPGARGLTSLYKDIERMTQEAQRVA